MRTRSHSLRSTLVLAAALLGIAPAAASQALTPVLGDPFPFRVSVPAGAEVVNKGGFLSAETKNVYVVVTTGDMLEEAGDGLPVSDTEKRRILTNMFLGSDALLAGMMSEVAREHGPALEDVVTEVRTLAGQRAGYLRGSFPADGGPGRLEAHMTIKDGVVYSLVVAVRGRDSEARRALVSGIQQSFALPDAPPPFSAAGQRAGGSH